MDERRECIRGACEVVTETLYVIAAGAMSALSTSVFMAMAMTCKKLKKTKTKNVLKLVFKS